MVNRQEFIHKPSGTKIAFDKGIESTTGEKAVNYWHRYNLNSTSKRDKYLDKDGKPIHKNNDNSHIKPLCDD